MTDLASGRPVPDARVRFYKDAVASLSAEPKVLSEGQTNADGMVLLPGTERVDPQLETFRHWSDDQAQRLVVRIDTEAAMALLPLDPSRFRIWTYRVSNWEVSEQEQKIYGHMHAWGTTAQGIYRTGDTIQYKIYVRDQDNARFIPPPRNGYSLEIIDPQGKTVHAATDLSLSKFGAYHGSFAVPQTAAVGWYSFTLRANFTEQSWQPLRVLVSDFTPASFRVTNTLNGDRFRPEARIEIETRARLHSGGPYTDALTRVTALLKPKPFTSDHALAKDFIFGSGGRPNQRSQQIFQRRGYVNDRGNLLSAFSIPPSSVLYGALVVESAVQDDRGKFIATTARAAYVGVDRFVGLKNTAWLYQEDEPAAVQLLVVDEQGTPVAGTSVTVSIERQVTKAARVKGAGNAYLTHFVEEWQKAATCSAVSGVEPLACTFIPEEPGSYRISAAIQDTKGKEHSTQIFAWVAGKGRVLWSRKKDDNSLQIIPEAAHYQIDDTARYLIKNPFPGATALVTVERYGVLKHWVQTLEGSTPVIEFPIEPDFLPGFYLSVLVVSPRVDTPTGIGQVDLGKPAFRMGYVQVLVKDPYKEVLVDVVVEQDNYKPRDRVNVSLQAQLRRPAKKEPIELAITVLDEAVFDLLAAGKNTFDPYAGFYRLDGLDLKNFNLLLRLVGRQKFEKKGADPGGDGGPGRSLRSLFKFVSYWNPSLIVDETGQADFSFDAPDNLTGWRVLVMAVTPTDRMGLGEGTFSVNRPTEVRPVMPNQVRAGDHFAAGFSVMNRTDQPREITVKIKAAGDVDADKTQAAHIETVRLAPYKRTTVWMEVYTSSVHTASVQAEGGTSQGAVNFTVTAGDDFDQDGLVYQLPVYQRRSFETAAAYGSTTQAQVQAAIEFPKNMHTDVGALSVTAAPTVIGNVEGAFSYMRDYPYVCWEQVLSKGVMAAQYLNLRVYMPPDFVWPDSQQLPQQTLDQAANYQAPNGGMTYFVPQDRYASP